MAEVTVLQSDRVSITQQYGEKKMRTSHWMAATAILLATQAVAQAQLLRVDVGGDLVNRGGRAIGTFEGVLEIVEFVFEDGQLIANGVLNGEVLNRAGRVITTLTDQAVSLRVTELIGDDGGGDGGSGVCQILNLTLGPLDLNVLGLIVELDTVNLDISADPAGGLLGQLLCGVADLLGSVLGDLLDLDLGTLLVGLDFLDQLLDLGLIDDLLDILNSIGSTPEL
jgi:hypothetical protein